MNPIVVYECEECGQTFTSELGLRAHDAVCIPRNMPGQSTFSSIKTDLFCPENKRNGKNDQTLRRKTY